MREAEIAPVGTPALRVVVVGVVAHGRIMRDPPDFDVSLAGRSEPYDFTQCRQANVEGNDSECESHVTGGGGDNPVSSHDGILAFPNRSRQGNFTNFLFLIDAVL
jgi:hypothetical protein